MSNRRKNFEQENIDFWKSSSDLMTALILILLLVIMFLVLYILQMPTEEFTDYNKDQYESMEGDGGHGQYTDDEYKDHSENNDSQNSGGGGGDGEGDDEGDFPNEGEGKKSAVLVTMVDADTDKAIPKKGVEFELYSDKNALQVLNTYYPKKKSYKSYETTKNGDFYLPEKILATDYFLHQLSELEGYDMSDRVDFTVDGIYDWNDPLVVKVPMYPKRDIIRVQMTDQETGAAIEGGEFEVIAAEDITTQDGTVRTKEGEKAGEIVCDEKGYGESPRLYLGKYKVKQSVIPEYYASNDKTIDVTLTEVKEKKDLKKKEELTQDEEEHSTDVNTIRAERTKINFVLTDELEGTPLAGAVYDVSGPGVEETMTTDDAGQIILDKVEKNGTYEFTEVTAVGDYIKSVEPVKVKISNKGRIGKEAQADVLATNRVLRLDVGVKDAILRNHLVDLKVELFSQSGKAIQSWTTNGAYTEITGLPEGKYYVTLDGNKNKKYNIVVTNTAQKQEYDINLVTKKSYLAIGGIAVFLVALIIGIVLLLRRIRRKKALQKAEEERMEQMEQWEQEQQEE